MKTWLNDCFFKMLAGIAVFCTLQLYGIIPTIHPVVALSEEDEELLMDFGSPMMRKEIEERRQSWQEKRASKKPTKFRG